MKKLRAGYKIKAPPSEGSFIDRILLYLLYRGGNATSARQALKTLHEEYVDLNEIRVAGLAELGTTLEQCRIPLSAAPLIRRFLRQTFADRGTFNLDFLADLSADQMRRYLIRTESLPSDAISYLIASQCGAPALPVEENTLRVAKRLSLVSHDSDAARCEQVLKRNIPKKNYLEFYLLVLEHGKKVCGPKPLCGRCVLAPECQSSAKTAS